MKSLSLAGIACALALVSVAHATPINLVANGSFEAGTGSPGTTGSFAGWTVTDTAIGTGPGKGPEYISYGSNATGYGDNIAADPFSFSGDPSGSHAAFFVDDAASESLSQGIAITAGQIYEVGFDFFETNSGARNPNSFTLSAGLNGTTLETISSGATYGAGTWYHVFDTFTAATSGTSGFVFSYQSGASAAKDVIVDDVYVELAPAADVPEPASPALLAAGLCVLTILGLRKRRFGQADSSAPTRTT